MKRILLAGVSLAAIGLINGANAADGYPPAKASNGCINGGDPYKNYSCLDAYLLSANGGSSAYNFAQSFAPGTGFYTLAASATAPIFDGFTLYNKQKAAEAALGQAEAQYHTTVIISFQNVADALRALQSDARAMGAARHAEDTAKASLDVVQQQLNAGQVNQLAVLNAQQTYLTASIIRVQTESQSSRRYRGAVHGAWRRMACYLQDTGLAGMRDGRYFCRTVGRRSSGSKKSGPWPSDRRAGVVFAASVTSRAEVGHAVFKTMKNNMLKETA
jgi:hypothetical protein